MSVMAIPMTFIMMTIMILKLSVVIMMINKIPQTMFNLMIIMLIIMVLIIKIIRVIYMKGLPVSMLPLLWYSFTQPSKPRPPQLARALLSALFSFNISDQSGLSLQTSVLPLIDTFDHQKCVSENQARQGKVCLFDPDDSALRAIRFRKMQNSL